MKDGKPRRLYAKKFLNKEYFCASLGNEEWCNVTSKGYLRKACNDPMANSMETCSKYLTITHNSISSCELSIRAQNQDCVHSVLLPQEEGT